MSDWVKVARLDEIPRLGARVVRSAGKEIAVFRTAEDQVYAMHDQCPHKGGPLSQGIVAGRQVTCPLHGMRIGLEDGQAAAPDHGCVPTIPAKIEDGAVYLRI